MRAGASLLVLGLLGVYSAAADEIVLGPSTQDVVITPGPKGGTVNVQFGSCTAADCKLPGPGLLTDTPPTVTPYTLIYGSPEVGPLKVFGPVGAVDDYPAEPGGVTAIIFGGKTYFLTYQFLYAASPNVQFTGIERQQPADYFDFSLQKLTCKNLAAGRPCTVQSIAGIAGTPGVGSAMAPISSGEFFFDVDTTIPEPASVVFVAAGLGALGLVRRRRGRS